MRQPTTDHQIVIVGAGYAGLHVALRSSADGRARPVRWPC
jgi:NADH dehydrogenase FAD-containing subunit